MSKCIDCKKEITKNAKRCRNCYDKLRKVYSHYCIDCGKELSKYCKSIRCYSCNNKITAKNNKYLSSEEAKKQRRTNVLGKHIHSEEFKENRRIMMKTKNPLWTKEGYKKFKEYINNRDYNGKNNPNFKDGTYKIRRPRDTQEYKEWRKKVFQRDNYTCQQCGHIGAGLEAHHIKSWIKYPELRYIVSNGLTLCIKCHPRGKGQF